MNLWKEVLIKNWNQKGLQVFNFIFLKIRGFSYYNGIRSFWKKSANFKHRKNNLPHLFYQTSLMKTQAPLFGWWKMWVKNFYLKVQKMAFFCTLRLRLLGLNFIEKKTLISICKLNRFCYIWGGVLRVSHLMFWMLAISNSYWYLEVSSIISRHFQIWFQIQIPRHSITLNPHFRFIVLKLTGRLYFTALFERKNNN